MTAHEVVSRIDANLSPRSTALLRSLLLRELAAQTAQASDCRTTISDLTGQTDVDSVLEREIAEASAVRADGAITDIEHALDRLDNGTFGTCDQCDAPIPFERLEAIPHARHCVACAGQRSALLG
jgi:DnaK suppressor protein